MSEHDHHHPANAARSPILPQYDTSYSPTNGSHSRSVYNSRNHPPTPAPLPLPTSARDAQYRAPLSPSLKGISSSSSRMHGSSQAREKGTSTYYDPTSDHPDTHDSWRHSHQSRQSPLQSHQARPASAYSDNTIDSNAYHPRHHSPVRASPQFSSPPQRYPSHPHSPGRRSRSPVRLVWDGDSSRHYRNGDLRSTSRAHAEPSVSAMKSNRTADPMSFSSILSNSTSAPVPLATSAQVDPLSHERSKASRDEPRRSDHAEELVPRRSGSRRTSNRTLAAPANDLTIKFYTNGEADEHPSPAGKPTKMKRETSDKENEASVPAFNVDELELSDVETVDFDEAKMRFLKGCRKRSNEVAESEMKKRKRRRTAMSTRIAEQLGRHAAAAELRFRQTYQEAAIAEVQHKEVLDEKERKKDMQRKRRREKTVQNETQKRNEAMEKARKAADESERVKFFKEAERADKKARHTKLILQGIDPTKELREVAPLAPNLEGGTMTSFSLTKPKKKNEPEPSKKKSTRGGSRPKKSKEQKQAEKDAAEAAHAALENNEPIPIVPRIKIKTKDKDKDKDKVKDKEKVKEKDKVKDKKKARELEREKEKEKEEKPTPVKKEPKPPKEEVIFVPYVSKGYNQIYDQIWRDLARKDIPRVYRIKETSLGIKQSNLRKTAQLAAKEARRWQVKTNRSMKDVQTRAKRSMREMMSFWKRNEREERDLRRMAERQELENAKKAEADREASRQKRKLNFLISQTELYSHFIGAKVKTDEVERSTDRADLVGADAAPSKTNVPAAANLVATDPSQPVGKVTDFEKLDFDDEDESNLQAIARANAQNAVQQAQDRARAFNQGGEAKELTNESFDGDEMNFQNPTSLGEIDIAQPKLLQAQLKEYQLKGLNWLVNLYEQGINGILADEMGLGKTVQSISVMAYLAEAHNIWGPFLVIAPASTLHNWQQEIVKFVPDLKVLPYWGNAKDRKVLRKFWDRKHITYTRDSPFHVLVTSYQLVVQDAQYFQKIRWQYMILDEAQAIKSSSSSRWKSLLGFSCRNRLLLTGTPIQNNMQELWALLHFIMPSLFDSHDEFSDWFSKDIESHAQSNTKLNEDQLKRLHMILKPFMLRRIKKHVQKELGDKIELDVFCDLTYRQRAYYSNLRNRISIMDLIEKAAVGDDHDTATLMNLVMQFRKVCNHPDLFERADTSSPLSFAHYAETASFLREGHSVKVDYSVRNLIQFKVPRLIYRHGGRLDLPGNDNPAAGFRRKYLSQLMNVWTPENIRTNTEDDAAFSWLRFAGASVGEVSDAFHDTTIDRMIKVRGSPSHLGRFKVLDDEEERQYHEPGHALFRIVDRNDRQSLSEVTNEGHMLELLNVSNHLFQASGLSQIEQCARPRASAPPIDVYCSSRGTEIEKEHVFFNRQLRAALYGPNEIDEQKLVDNEVDPAHFPMHKMLPAPISERSRYTNIQVPSMRRFVTDSGKLAKLDSLLTELKEGGHRVLLYFQMTRMIDLMEEYLTYRNYKYLRLDGSTKLEDRRDTVHDFQTRPEIFVFLLSTRAGGLGINLTAADTVIFYDSDWNPTIDSQAMDRAHRLGQTRQVTVYRMITRGTIEERIRKRALQKEEVQRVVISGGSGAGVDFNTRSKENRTKDIAMWLADDDQAAEIERKEAEIAAAEAAKEAAPSGGKKSKATAGGKKRKADVSLEELYHEGEGHFDDGSNKPSGAATPVGNGASDASGVRKATTNTIKKGTSKKAKTAKERLRMADGDGGL